MGIATPFPTPSLFGASRATAWAALVVIGIALAPPLRALESWWLPDYYVPEELLPSERTRGFRLGGMDFYPRLSASAVYDDNINISRGSGTRESDLIWSVAPSLSMAVGETGGRSLTLSYAPAFLSYTEHSRYHSIDHAASLQGILPFSKLTLGLNQSFRVRSGGVAEVGRRADQTACTTALTSRYELGEKASVEVNGSQNIVQYDQSRLYSSRTWANDNWFNYQVLSKVTTGLGLSLGYVEADQHPNQLFERVALRGTCALASKVNLAAWVGGEWRQYDDSGSFAPVFSLSGSYTPRLGTALTLEGHRREENSAVLARHNFISTGFSAGISQQILQRYSVHLTAGYDNLDYHATARGVAETRQDDTCLVRVGVDAVLFRRMSVGLFYQFRDNRSNESSYRFFNNQLGLVASYSF